MNYYIKDFHFKKTFFRKRLVIVFKFYLGDKWRRGKVLFSKDLKELNVNNISAYITAYIDDYISYSKTWSKVEIQKINPFIELYSKNIILETTRLYK